MTPVGYLAHIRNKIKGSTIDADYVEDLTNEVLPIVGSKVIKKDNLGRDILGVIGYADLSEGVREYPLPDDLLNKIIGVEVKLSNADDAEWQELESFDLTSYRRTTDEANIVAIFKYHPKYDIYRESLWIYSDTITNTAADNKGLKLWYAGEFKEIDITDDTDDMSVSPIGEEDVQNFKRGIPKSIQYWLVRYVLSEVKADRDIALTEYETSIWLHLDELLDEMKNIDTKQVIEYISPDLSQVGRYGYDY